MKLMNKLIIDNLKMNKKRTRTTVISIVLSCMLLFSLTIAFSSYEHADIQSTIETSGSYHVQYRNLDYKSTYDYLKKDADVESIDVLEELKKLQVYETNMYGEEEKVDASIMSFEKDLSKYLTLYDGSFPQNDKELAISLSFASKLRLKIGDTFDDYKIVAIYRSNRLKNGEYVGRGTENYAPTLYTKRASDQNNSHSTFVVTYKSPKKTYDKILDFANRFDIDYELGSLLENEFIKDNALYLSKMGIYRYEDPHLKLHLLLYIVLYVLGLFCALIIYNSFSISLVERKRQYGILRSIGASKKQIIKLVAREILILGFTSIPIAFLLSTGLISLVLHLINHVLGQNLSLYISPKYMFVTLLFVIFTIAISAITPARKAAKTSPIESIRNAEDVAIKKSRENYSLIRKLFGVEGEVAYKNMKRNSKKFTSTIISLSVSILLFITASTFINGIALSLSSYRDDFDIRINLFENEPADTQSFIDRISSSKNIDDIIIEKSTMLNVHNTTVKERFKNKSELYVSIYALDDNSLNEYKKTLKIENDKPILYNILESTNEDGSTQQYRVFENEPIVEIYDDNTDETYLTLSNLNVAEENYNGLFNGATIIVNMNEFDKLVDEYIGKFPKAPYTQNTYPNYLKSHITIKISSKNFKNFDKEIKESIKDYPQMKIDYVNSTLENYEAHMQEVFVLAGIYSVLAFIAIISLSSMLNSLNTNIELRKTEFAMLRSIGLSKLGLDKMIKLENFFIIVKTLIIGILLSLTTIYGIRYISAIRIGETTAPEPIPFPWIYIAISVLFCIIIVSIATRFSLKKIKKLNIVDSIRKEST